MGSRRNLKKEFPSVVDSAYKQYLQDLSRYKEVKEIMSQEVVTIAPEASMAEATVMMGEKHIGSLIVVKYGTPVGIVTERDLLSKVIALGLFQ
jgi:predicted transcriptional regulator